MVTCPHCNGKGTVQFATLRVKVNGEEKPPEPMWMTCTICSGEGKVSKEIADQEARP